MNRMGTVDQSLLDHLDPITSDIAFPTATEQPAKLKLCVSHLSKSFGGGVRVLHQVNLNISTGQSVAVVGSNGCGKSTLMRCCLRLIEPDSGTITLLGEDILKLRSKKLHRLRGRVGIIWQRHNLVARLSVLSNVIHGALCRADDPRLWRDWSAPKAVRDEAMACLERVDLTRLALRRADQLSGGESQRVAIARALMQRPEMVFADEPVASLDPKVGEEVMVLLVHEMQERGVTLIFISHDLDHALKYSRRILGMHAGRIVLDRPSLGTTKVDLKGLYES